MFVILGMTHKRKKLVIWTSKLRTYAVLKIRE